MEEDISIVKCNISNLHKAAIPRKNPRKHSEIALTYIFLNQNRSLHNSFDAKIV